MIPIEGNLALLDINPLGVFVESPWVQVKREVSAEVKWWVLGYGNSILCPGNFNF